MPDWAAVEFSRLSAKANWAAGAAISGWFVANLATSTITLCGAMRSLVRLKVPCPCSLVSLALKTLVAFIMFMNTVWPPE